jgi:hypothetical protein
VKSRIIFIFISFLFSLLTIIVYKNYFVGAEIYEYMGIRAFNVPWYLTFLSLIFSIIPSVWLKLDLKRPSQILILYIYFTVHIQSCVLIPIVSKSTYFLQFVFIFVLTIAQLSLEIIYKIPLIRIKVFNTNNYYFNLSIFFILIIFFVYLLANGSVNLDSFSLIEVYDQRAELMEKGATIGILFFYLTNWLGAVILPYLLIISLKERHRFFVIVVIFLALINFALSSNKTNYMNLLLIFWGFFMLIQIKKMPFSILLSSSFILIILILSFFDFLNSYALGETNHFFSWLFFHRTFTNNGYLSAIYLDLMQNHEYGLYQNSFLSWMKISDQEPIAVLAGKSFTDVEGVHANANIWADAYANLGYLGILLSSIILGILLYTYDSLALNKNLLITTLLLFVQASVISNTPIYTALLSNGFLLLFVLVYFLNIDKSSHEYTILQKE